MPYVRAWAEKYKDSGLVVIGVHTPEFAFEKDPENVRRAVGELGIPYPVALDNEYKIWRAFGNHYWPADYLIDTVGRIRHKHFGEGEYDESEQQIQELLKERNGQMPAGGLVTVAATGAEAAPTMTLTRMRPTSVMTARKTLFLRAGFNGMSHIFTRSQKRLELNQWGLAGTWIDSAQIASLESAPGKIIYRFHARDLHLVLGPASEGKPVRFRVKIDGRVPGVNHGVDTDAQGNGKITEHRLYQLIRQKSTAEDGSFEDRTFEIEFLDPGAQAFAFTFG